MRKGFTLIELLAVIVILAIIALIATPIVLEMINDSKESAVLRSAEFYLDGVEHSIATAMLKNQTINDGQYSIMEDGNICLETPINNTCPQEKTLEVNIKGEKPSSGTITITSGEISNISLDVSNKTVVKNSKGELVYLNKLLDVCIPITVSTSGIYTAGDKYQCKVKDEMETGFEDGYYFYVLSTQNAAGEIITETSTDKTVVSVNLIMDRNINSDGTVATKAIEETEKEANGGIYNLVVWNESQVGTNGPVVAIQFLYNATKDWTNVPALNYEYNEREYNGILESNTNRGYKSFVSNNGVATIIPLSGASTTIGTTDIPLRARMPIFSTTYDSNAKGEVFDKKEDNSNIYLYDYLALYNNIQTNSISKIYGYWTLSSYVGDDGPYPWIVGYTGDLTYGKYVSGVSTYGVRSVINLKL